MSCVFALVISAGFVVPGKANARSFRLSVPDELVASGFLKHLLPRFSLKTGVRIEIVAQDAASEAGFSATGKGTSVFSGLGRDWVLVVVDAGNENVVRFRDWVTGEVGKKTIDAFRPDGKVVFTAAIAKPEDVSVEIISGDAASGEKLAVLHCGRCHMVNETTRLTTIGSTPSFAIMRNFSDWRSRFEAFFVLNPHPSFTQVEGVTEPFAVSRPPSIVPLELTLEELDAILAFVSRIPPADLGAPIQYD
ncbi:hypothetical protein [Roseibium sp.]|uniref:hypothetical protein n=1 Tax=Roseibium sp. TaxID=1936156 RepID=UPI002610503E|nr:hypothetical protein [Roseibium sp.]